MSDVTAQEKLREIGLDLYDRAVRENDEKLLAQARWIILIGKTLSDRQHPIALEMA